MDQNRFDPLNALRAQYMESIDEILIECEHVYRSTIDYDLLNTKIEQLLQLAKTDGLEEKIIWDILHARIPTYVNYINYTKQKNAGKKAA